MKRRRWGEEIPLLHVAVRLAVDIFQLHPGLLAPYAVGVLVKAVQQEAQELLRHQAGDTRARHGRTTDNTERPKTRNDKPILHKTQTNTKHKAATCEQQQRHKNGGKGGSEEGVGG